MSQQVFNPVFGNPSVPGSYVVTKVAPSSNGVLSVGVVILVGEAEQGPDYTQETSLLNNSFGPDEAAAVIAKYGSGPLVDAFVNATTASNDTQIAGTFTRAILVKTNVSTKATGTLSRAGLTSYSTISDQSFGVSGNQSTVSVTATQSEVGPTTGSFTYVPASSAIALGTRTNGSVRQTLTIAANTGPLVAVGSAEDAANTSLASIEHTSGVPSFLVTGGTNRNVIGAGSIGVNISLVATGNSVVISLASGSWSTTPQVGDLLVIPNNNDYAIAIAANSVLVSGAASNRGSYVVTAATSSTVTATKVRDYGAATVTAPANRTAIAIVDVDEFVCYSPVTISQAAGTERSVLISGLVGQTVQGVASGSTLTLTLATGQVWNALPQAGDLLLISRSAPAAWRASGANTGWYQVTASTLGTAAGASTITMTRLSNGSPTSFSATAIAAITDFRVFRPAIDGVGKSVEITDGGGTEALATTPLKFMNLSPNTNVSWLSTASAPVLLRSASEYVASINEIRVVDNVNNSVVAGGDVMLTVGYRGNGLVTTGTLTISGTTLTTTVVGGNGSNLSVDLRNFRTVNELATFINSQPGYSAAAGNTALGLARLIYTLSDGTKGTILDKGTWGIASENGSLAGRIKKDGYAMWEAVDGQAALIQLGTSGLSVPSAGLPEVTSLFFLSGGTKGATTSAILSALFTNAMPKVKGNFVIPLFSRDASSDITEGLTDSGSTYTISAIHALVKAHCALMSQPKRRGWRQGFLSIKGTFAQARTAAQSVADARCSMTFQDVRALNSQGEIAQFQPWMAATLAAAMQAGGFNEPIVKKFVSVSGVVFADSAYGDEISSQEVALAAGLLPLETTDTNGVRWLSDQTTYSVDNNFVYNSIQAVYMMDVLAALIADRMERRFIGRPLSEISDGVMSGYLQGVLREALNLKITAPSVGAENGYRNARVKITAPYADVSVEVSLGTGLYFILTTAFITRVESNG